MKTGNYFKTESQDLKVQVKGLFHPRIVTALGLKKFEKYLHKLLYATSLEIAANIV